MASARKKKKGSVAAAQAIRKSSRGKGGKRMRSIAARSRTELRRGMVPSNQDVVQAADANVRLADRFGERSRNTFIQQHATEQWAAGNLGPGMIFASAMRTILKEISNFVEESMHQNFTRLLALTYCRTPPQIIAAQRDLIQDNAEGVVRSTGRIADVTIQMAQEGVRRMSVVSWVLR